ncbi:MAG TPA: hypothetical protein VHQ46_04400 [Desulfobacteria bacterium]|nr:hypothetical protein [Desulfobacteria bacterium]
MMLRIAFIMLIPLLVAVYTVSFGRYTWRTGNRLGAIGVYLLAMGSVSVPLLVLIIKQ